MKAKKLLCLVIGVMMVAALLSMSLVTQAATLDFNESEPFNYSGTEPFKGDISTKIGNKAVVSDGMGLATGSGSYKGLLFAGANKKLGTAVIKYDATAGYHFDSLTVKVKGRSLKSGEYVRVYYCDSLNGTYEYLGGFENEEKGYTTSFKTLNSPSLGANATTAYIKIEIYTTSGTNASVNELLVTGTMTDEQAEDIAEGIEVNGLADNALIAKNSSLTFTAVANPTTISNRTVTVASSNEGVVTVTDNGNNSYTLNPVSIGTAQITITSNLTSTVSAVYNVKIDGIVNDYAEVIKVTAANAVDNSKFETYSGVTLSNENDAVMKLAGVSFADFCDTGANFIKANVAWGENGNGAAQWDFYIDSVIPANKVASLYAMPFEGSLSSQVANAFCDTAITGTHDIYIVYKNAYSGIIDVKFGNNSGSYVTAPDFDVKASSDVMWDTSLINYSGMTLGDSCAYPKYNVWSHMVFRIDANHATGSILDEIEIYASLRNYKDKPGIIKIAVSTDLSNWNEVFYLDTALSPDDIKTTTFEASVTEKAKTMGSEVVYVKISFLRANSTNNSWNSINHIKFTTTDLQKQLKGDANGDSVVDVLDYITFKLANEGADVTIPDGAYYAGLDNLDNDLDYTLKSLLGIEYTVDTSRYEVKNATGITTDVNGKTPSVLEAKNLMPSTNLLNGALINSARIKYCLENYGFCTLAAGETFEIDAPIVLSKPGLTLTSASADNKATIMLAEDTEDADCVIEIKSGAEGAKISNLIINQNFCYKTGDSLDAATIKIKAAGVVVDNCDILGGDVPEGKDINETFAEEGYGENSGYVKHAGVYFLNGAEGSVVKNSTIKNNFYGVIFHSSLTENTNNRLENCVITYNRCDGITFSGYGYAKDCTISYNGFDCANGNADGSGHPETPIPGAGVYSSYNAYGYKLEDCLINHNNGYNIDTVNTANVVITGCTVDNAGCRKFPLAEDYQNVTYANGIAAIFQNVSNSTITGNTFSNKNAENVLKDDYNAVYFGGANGIDNFFGANYANLPAGSKSVVAVVLAGSSSTGNTITGNTIVANVESDDSITGYGLFISNDCGTNTISDNIYTGSDVGILDCRS